jgi:8-oxo-dGTP pyrophosphatase MutT (NUDIX family)
MPYIQQIRQFKPLTDSEKSDKQVILDYLSLIGDDILSRRSQLAHLTSSGFILNPSMTKTLMVHHNIYQTWAWTGGHADGDRDLLKIAIKEAKEEAGLKRISPLVDHMLSLDILTVKGHYKRGEYVSAHLHLSAAYVLIAEEDEELTVKPDENSDVAWIAVEEMNKMSNEPEMIPVYQKLYERALEIKNKQKSY